MRLLKVCIPTLLYTIMSFSIYASKSDSLGKYYELVHRAHIEICKDDLNKARILFDSAFLYMKVPFMPDINNALYVEVNMSNPDKNRIVHYLKVIQQKGLCVHEMYKKREMFIPYLSLVSETDCKKVIDMDTKEAIVEAMNDDQKIRHDSYEKYKDLYHPAVLPQMEEVDKKNFRLVDSVFRLAQKKNLKVEDLLGIESYNEAFVILLHNIRWGNSNNSLLYQMAKSGLIDARYIALQIDDFCALRTSFVSDGSDCGGFYRMYGTFALKLTMDKAFIMIPPDDIYGKIMKKRKELYLQDLIEESKIKSFASLNAKSGIYCPGGFDMDSSMGEEQNASFEKILKRYNPNIIKYNGKEDFDFDRN